MTISRRRVLWVIGGGVIAAAGASAAYVGTRTPHRALRPWALAAGAHADWRRYVLSHALLAPNPHNLQPWRVRLEPDGFTLYVDPASRLPQTDPFDRQITIGLGCFLELARIAASQLDAALHVEAFPQAHPHSRLGSAPIAHCRLERAAATPDPLFAHVLTRRSCKEPFDAERAPTPAQFAALTGALGGGVGFDHTADVDTVDALRRLTWRAHEIEAHTPRTHQESIDLMRIGRGEIEARPDGIDLGGPFLSLLALAGVLTRERMADPTSDAFVQGLDMYRTLFAATPAFVWLSTDVNTRDRQLHAGAAYLRLNLAATGLGLAMHPVSQCLQEYPEMREVAASAHAVMGAGAARVQMLARIGYGPDTPPSPRWPLEARVHS